MLDEMERVLSARLADACGYAPVPMGEALELPARLRWAASRRYGSTGGQPGPGHAELRLATRSTNNRQFARARGLSSNFCFKADRGRKQT